MDAIGFGEIESTRVVVGLRDDGQRVAAEYFFGSYNRIESPESREIEDNPLFGHTLGYKRVAHGRRLVIFLYMIVAAGENKVCLPGMVKLRCRGDAVGKVCVCASASGHGACAEQQGYF